MSFARNVRELRLDAQEPLDGAAEMPQIPEGVKPNPVRAQHSRNQFASARMATENLVGWKGCVQEKPNFEVGSRRSQHRGEKHELVIMHPDQIAFVHRLKHLFSEDSVYVLVMFPPSRFVTQIIGQVMKQWPDAGIGKTLVECGNFFLAEKHRDAAMFFGQLPRDFLSPAFFGKRSTRPTDPLSLVLFLGKPFQRSHESTGRLGDSILFHGNWQAIGDVDEGVRHTTISRGNSCEKTTMDSGRCFFDDPSSYPKVTLIRGEEYGRS